MQKRALEILITNDDSYISNGIEVLTNILSNYGNITVIAPKGPQSAKGTSVSLHTNLYLEKISEEKSANGHTIRRYFLSGTPVDCVKLALNKFFIDRYPDFLASGINHGSNASAGAIYSGTLGAAKEATIYGIPAIGVSIDEHSMDANLDAVKEILPTIIDKFIASTELLKGSYLNVNFPNLPLSKIKGVKIAAQGKGKWIKEFQDKVDENERECLWMTGEYVDMADSPISDHKLLKEGYITVVPHKIDTTNYQILDSLQKEWNL